MSTIDDLLIRVGLENSPTASTERRTPTIDMESPAFRGIAGEIVRHADKFIEASPINSLAQFLTMFSASVGNNPHFYIAADRHSSAIFNCIVGRTAKSRKGSAESAVLAYFVNDEGIPPFNSQNGIGSGEGIIDLIREREEDEDSIVKLPILIDEAELSMLFKVMERNGATAHATILKLWDGKPIGNVTKGKPFKASDYHVCINGHIQIATLKQQLKPEHMRSGFANRFSFIYADRDKTIGRPRQYIPDNLLRRSLQEAIERARGCGEFNLSEAAGDYWEAEYPTLTQDRPGIIGDITSRNEPMALRYALIYALLDQSPCIEITHIESGLAMTSYSELTVDYLYGGVDPELEELRFFLEQMGGSATQTDVSTKHYQKHKSKQELDAIRQRAIDEGVIYVTQETSGGAPRWVWRLV